jgi:hypothetical protein
MAENGVSTGCRDALVLAASVKSQRIDFTLNLRDVLRNVLRHVQGDLAQLIKTLLLVVESRHWEHHALPDLVALLERSPAHGGCGVKVAEIIIYLRVALEIGTYAAPAQEAIEALIELLEAPDTRTRAQRRRRRSERVGRLLNLKDVELLASKLQQTLTPTQQRELSERLRQPS